MAMFEDTVTVFQKQPDGSYRKTIVDDCMWSDQITKTVESGKLVLAKTATVTFRPPFSVDFKTFCDEDAIFFGKVAESPKNEKGKRLSDVLRKYGSKAGIVRGVNDNSNRDMLPNIKVTVY